MNWVGMLQNIRTCMNFYNFYKPVFLDTTQLLTTSNFTGPWYHVALLFSGLGSIVLLFVLLFS